MSKKHHPKDRLERIRIREEKQQAKTKASHVRRRFKNEAKRKEADDALRLLGEDNPDKDVP